MITESNLYWILKLDDIHHLLGVFSFVGVIAAVLAAFAAGAYNFNLSEYDEPLQPKTLWWPGTALIFLCLCGVVGTFIPTTKQMVMIKGIPALLTSQKDAVAHLGKTPVKIVDLLNKYLDQELKRK